MPYSQKTSSPTLFITSTSQQQISMTQGFVDRMTYKLMFKPLDLNSFHKVTQYVIKKVLCQPYINLKGNNYLYLNHNLANQSVSEIFRKLALNIITKGEENYLENNKLMQTLKVAVRDSKNLTKVSKYSEIQTQNNTNCRKLWYFK